MAHHFPAAPWTTALKLTSLLVPILLVPLLLGVVSTAPYSANHTAHAPVPLGVWLPLLLLILLVLGSALFIVRGYTVDSDHLAIERLVTTTRIPLTGLQRVWADANVRKGSVRVCGNGGLFSYTGWYYNKRLGLYRLFATNFQRGVVLQFADRVVVLSPADPQAFVEHVHHLIPDLRVGPDEGSA
jgi:hypothetical protein